MKGRFHTTRYLFLSKLPFPVVWDFQTYGFRCLGRGVPVIFFGFQVSVCPGSSK
jgi:hypothetical protein